MHFCPHCGGDLAPYLSVEATPGPQGTGQTTPIAKKYDQTATWKNIMTTARERGLNPPDATQLGYSAAATVKGHTCPISTIVHIAFDRPVVPQGGVLGVMLEGKGTAVAEDRFEALGYEVEGGKVKTVDEVPVGPAYGVLDYWGGEKQHRRWHLAKPVEANPSRHGNPFFMDENMIAFGATWRDTEKIEPAMLELLTLFEHGVNGAGCIATPVVLELVPRP